MIFKSARCRTRDTPLWGVYIPTLAKISVILKFLDDTLIAAPMEVKYGMEKWTVEISPPLVQRAAPAGQKNLKMAIWVT